MLVVGIVIQDSKDKINQVLQIAPVVVETKDVAIQADRPKLALIDG